MSKYELIIVLSEEVKDAKKAIDSLIKEHGFSVSEQEDMEVRELAYQIQKQNNGHYHKLILEGDGRGLAKLESAFNIQPGVLRYLTIALTPKLEKIREVVKEARVERQAKNEAKLKAKES